MKKLIFTIAFVCLIVPLSAQDWETPYNFDTLNYVQVMYADPTNDSLYVGGDFREIGGQLINGIASFDGTTFRNLGKGSFCGNIYCNQTDAIIRYKNELYASIQSIYIGGEDSLGGLARWDGNNWNDVGNYVGACNPAWWHAPAPISKFIVDDNKLYIGGLFRCINYDTIQGVASWDGNKWTNLGLPNDFIGGSSNIPLMNSIAVYKNQLYAAGKSYLWEDGAEVRNIYRYDTISENQGWHSVGGGMLGITSVLDLAVFKGELYAAGFFWKGQGNAGNCIMRWDGNSWKDVGDGLGCDLGRAIRRMYVHDDELFVVGGFDCIGGIPANNIAKWDGEKWCSVGTSKFDKAILDATYYKNDFYICGAWSKINGVTGYTFAKWVGDHNNDICGIPASEIESSRPPTTLQITPNPATEAIRITLPTMPKSAEIRFINTLGQVFLQKKVENLPEPALVQSIDTWPSGLYFVEIRGADGQVWGGRFLKN